MQNQERFEPLVAYLKARIPLKRCDVNDAKLTKNHIGFHTELLSTEQIDRIDSMGIPATNIFSHPIVVNPQDSFSVISIPESWVIAMDEKIREKFKGICAILELEKENGAS